MILSKMKLLGAAVGVAVVVGSLGSTTGRQRMTKEMGPIMSSDRTAN